MKLINSLILFIFFAGGVTAQFAPQAGVPGSTAIHANDKRLIAWGTTCKVERGWLDIADTSQGKVTLGEEAYGIGKADNKIVSLGDGGSAVITFPAAMYDGPGPDFAVFEYGFVNPGNPEEAFLELAFVEVSSDGQNYVRFPATSLTDTPQVPGAGVYMNARKINNLAGKYTSGYGTPFDLSELSGKPGLDVNHITHVRIVDVVGSLGDNSTYDNDGNKINDPYPTPFPSGGFDLDAVGVLSIPGWYPAGIDDPGENKLLKISPNPATEFIQINLHGIHGGTITITDVTGRVMYVSATEKNDKTVNISGYPGGMYYVILTERDGNKWTERFIKY